MGRKNLILVDFDSPDDWDFIAGLRSCDLGGSRWVVKKSINNTKFFHTGFGNILRCMVYFLFPLTLVPTAGRYGTIIGWQQFYGICLAFWQRLFHVGRRNSIVIMTFIYKQKSGLAGRIHHHFVRYALGSKSVGCIICHSSHEVTLYTKLFGLKDGVAKFIPLGIDCDKSTTSLQARSQRMDGEALRIFSTGRSNRDYDFLIKALSGTRYHAKIACEWTAATDDANTEIVHDCYGEKMLETMKVADVVCIPLADTEISSGQLVILQAFQAGKPVIVTRNSSAHDYINDGIDGFIIEKTKAALIAKLDLLDSNPTLYKEMSANALRAFMENYTSRKMGERLFSAISLNPPTPRKLCPGFCS